MTEQSILPPDGEFLLYNTEDGITRLEVRLSGETVWLNQEQMAELFQSTKQNIGQHIRNVFKEGELQVDSVVNDFFTTAADSKQFEAAVKHVKVLERSKPTTKKTGGK